MSRSITPLHSFHFPVDLETAVAGSVVDVGGRVIHLEGTRVVLADAFRRCDVDFAVAWRPGEMGPANLGDWAHVRGTLAGDSAPRVTDATLIAVHPGAFKTHGLFARFGKVAPHLRSRAKAMAAIRSFFSDRSFLEVSTPVRVAAPGTDVYLEPQPSGDEWLITSPEFHLKRLLVGGLPRIFEFARCTRRDEAGRWHQPEFTMLEWYSLFQSFDELLDETEQLVAHVAMALGCGPTIDVNDVRVDLQGRFERLTVADAFRTFAGVHDVATLAAEDEDQYFQLMVDEVDPGLSRCPRPVLLTHYPLSQAALSTPSVQHPGFAERFELFIGGVELCNGYGELTCPVSQRERFDADVRKRYDKGLPAIPVDDGLLAALEEGLPPCAGNALGFDRLLAVLLEQPLSEVMAFPVRSAG